MLRDVIRHSGLSHWLEEYVTSDEGPRAGGLGDRLDRLQRYQEELEASVIALLAELRVPGKVASKWLQLGRGAGAPGAAEVEQAQRELETFLSLILPQVLRDRRGLAD
jgi:hypothetical protein